MLYVKNVPVWERVLRVIAAVPIAYFGVQEWPSLIGYALISTSIVAALTGFVGFCPMCALAGRRLKS